MNRKPLRLAAAGLFLSNIFSYAGADNTAPLTWPEAVQIAKANNPDLLSSLKSMEAARASYKGSYNGLLPSISLGSAYTTSDRSTVNDGRWSAEGRASMDVLNLRNNSEIDAASADLRKTEADFILQSSNVRLSLKQSFADLLFAQNEVDVSTRIRALRKQNSDMVNLKYESGRESKGNMLRSKAELTEAEVDLNSAMRNLSVAQRDLARQLGQLETLRTATGTLDTADLPSNLNYSDLVESNPRVQSQEALRAGSLAQLKNSRSTLWPTLSANYSRTSGGDSFFPKDEYHWNASGVLSYPIFAGGLTSTMFAISAAKRNLEKADADLTSVRNGVRVDLESTYADFAEKADEVKVQSDFLVAARQRNTEAQVRYSSGLMAFENWEPIVTDLVNFERSYLRAQHDAYVAEATWEKTTGKKLEDQ